MQFLESILSFVFTPKFQDAFSVVFGIVAALAAIYLLIMLGAAIVGTGLGILDRLRGKKQKE